MINRCPITYDLCGSEPYSQKGLKLLSNALKVLSNLTAEELRAEAMVRACKMSIQGVQPKLSAVLNIKNGFFETIDLNGKYILKPQHPYFPELPQNEDLTMRLASSIGIEVPLHGLICTPQRRGISKIDWIHRGISNCQAGITFILYPFVNIKSDWSIVRIIPSLRLKKLRADKRPWVSLS